MSPEEAATGVGVFMAMATRSEGVSPADSHLFACVAGIRFAQLHPEWAIAIADVLEFPVEELAAIVRHFPLEMTGAPQ